MSASTNGSAVDVNGGNVITAGNTASASMGQAANANAGNVTSFSSSPSPSSKLSSSLESSAKNSNVAKKVEQSTSATFSDTTTTTEATDAEDTRTPPIAETTIVETITTVTATTTSSPSSFPFALHYLASFHQICMVTALLPLFTLFSCFVTAYVFQYDEVHETHCRVYNIIPSISAITGVSPQRYFWRFSIALHIGPRIPIAFVYKNYYRSMLQTLTQEANASVLQKANILIGLILILNCIEVAALGGVTYVSNRENYPVHERIFITFMTCSLCHMLATIKLHGILHADPQQLTHQQRESIKWKKYLFVMSILSTIGLLIFFAKHRFYCHDLAFSWFAFFEYLIAVANMLFHFTIIWDFPSQYMIIVQGPRDHIEELLRKPPPPVSAKKLN